jgi:hypothetical protein
MQSQVTTTRARSAAIIPKSWSFRHGLVTMVASVQQASEHRNFKAVLPQRANTDDVAS